jgi:uncharacterized lipoprotein NlpE involved in copper resistance
MMYTQAAPAPAARPPAAERSFLGEFAGTLPCAGCLGIEMAVTFYGCHSSDPGGMFRTTERYLGIPDGDRTFESTGRWSFVRDIDFDREGSIVRLQFDHSGRVLHTLRVAENELMMLDRACRESDTIVNRMLRKVTGLPGGYCVASAFANDVRDAAEFAVIERTGISKQPVVLEEIVRAERQTAAGDSYRLCLDVTVGGRPIRVLASVYRDLLQRFLLTGWETAQWPDD